MFSREQRSSLAANIILPILAIGAVALRLLVVRRTKSGVGASEYVITFAMLLAAGGCVLGLYATCNGLIGVRLDKLPPHKFQQLLLIVFVDTLLCHITFGIIKISILLFYKRLFPTSRFQAHANAVIGIIALFTTIVTLVQIFLTTPVEAAWHLDSFGKPHENYNHNAFMVSVAAINIVLDLWTLALPLPVIGSLHVHKRKKIGITVLFLLGALCVLASAVRLYYVVALLYVYTKAPERVSVIANFNDIWAHIEACASIVTACLPTLAPLYRKLPWATEIATTLESWVMSVEGIFKSSPPKSDDKTSPIWHEDSRELLNQG